MWGVIRISWPMAALAIALDFRHVSEGFGTPVRTELLTSQRFRAGQHFLRGIVIPTHKTLPFSEPLPLKAGA